MSDELNKEMEELEEVSEVEEASAPTATNPSSVKLKQEKENMQKAKTSGKASDPKATKEQLNLYLQLKIKKKMKNLLKQQK